MVLCDDHDVVCDAWLTYVSVHKPEAYNMRKECLVQEIVLICIARRGAEGVKAREDKEEKSVKWMVEGVIGGVKSFDAVSMCRSLSFYNL